MPTILRAPGLRILFYSHEPGEPPHVHVDCGGSTAKVWLQPVTLVSSTGFRAHELTTVLKSFEPIDKPFWRLGMDTLAPTYADTRVRDLSSTEHELAVVLMDGWTITVRLAWYPRLANASPQQRTR